MPGPDIHFLERVLSIPENIEHQKFLHKISIDLQNSFIIQECINM